MFTKATWLHLRIPFSIFLLPVYLFAVSISEAIIPINAFLVFFILHFLVYPASNGYNSFFDKDEDSIGGLKNPPKVSGELYYTSLLFDLLAIILALFIGWEFAIMIIVYGLVSKAYSHPSIRLKRLPYIGWLIAGLFQGSFTFIMVYLGINGYSFIETMQSGPTVFAAFLSTLLLWGSYPMTQVYQHEEDARRGDQTLSIKLGILGTFHFTATVFFLANLGFLFFYLTYYHLWHAVTFQVFILPMLVYFVIWYKNVRKNRSAADYEATMKLNIISSLCMNAFFLLFYFSS